MLPGCKLLSRNRRSCPVSAKITRQRADLILCMNISYLNYLAGCVQILGALANFTALSCQARGTRTAYHGKHRAPETRSNSRRFSVDPDP